MPSSLAIQIFSTPEELFSAAACEFASLAAQAVSANGRFTVALAGGSTPRGLYSLLARSFASSLPWEKICFFWGDERHVPPGHSDSNYRMARDSLLSKVPAKPENIFRIPAENPDALAVAAAYEQTLKSFFQLREPEFPRFDLVLLGLGPDAHTASLFPGSEALRETSRLVVAHWVAKLTSFRITLTLPVLNNSSTVVFLVSGQEKQAAVRAVFTDSSDAAQFPAKLIQPVNGRLLWMLDQDAAGKLPAASQRATETPGPASSKK